MKFRKIGFVASQKPEAIEALKKLKKLYKNVPPNKADIIVALGGDGTILKCLHDYLKKKIPILLLDKWEDLDLHYLDDCHVEDLNLSCYRLDCHKFSCHSPTIAI